MAIRRIEVPIFGKDSVDSLLDCAAVLAIPFDAQIEARFIRPSAGDAALYDAGFGFASASLIDQIETEGVSAAAAARHKFESWRERHAARPLVTWSEEEGHTGAVVARRGCLSDVILLQRATAKDAAIDEPFEAAVYGAGRLAMVVDRTLPANFLDHVLIAWNESTEASRAVAQSLPFLVKAKRVSIFAAAEAGGRPADVQDLIGYLALQDVTAAQAPVAASHAPIGETLLKLADARGASLLVMGAYTHNRVRQMLFGGVTQHILTTPGLPALLAH
jgi:nucleotide-binding universal stress UspA family protein